MKTSLGMKASLLAGRRRVRGSRAGVVDGAWLVRRRRSAAWHPLRSLLVLAGVPVLVLGLTAGPAAASGGGRVTFYASISGPSGITAGPDGALWFTNTDSDSIGRITTTGTITHYTGTGISNPVGIAAGPDGALWFTNVVNNTIGRITTTGKVTIYTGTGISEPEGITAGPDGALWFTNSGRNTIGRITTTGTVTHYTSASISGPQGIAAGPDGALWFTNGNGNSIGRITTTGTVTTYSDPGISTPQGITAGPDGALWFTNEAGDSIGRITTTVTPKISKLTPTSGAAGASVTIAGLNLSGATAVAFHGTRAAIVSDTATKIVTKVPAGATTGHVSVTTSAGTATSTKIFTVP